MAKPRAHAAGISCLPVLAVLLLAINICSCGATKAEQQSSTITFQIHSWNDLDEWQQALKKSQTSSAATWLKIDPHFMDASFCANQSQAPKGDQRGCLLLSHDTPTEAAQLNSTGNLVALFSDPNYIHFFTQKQRVHIALCFKNMGQPCANTIESNNWLSLADTFIGQLQDTIQKHSLNVEIILDGDGVPTGGNKCLWDRWRPLVSTWISNPMEALFSNSTAEALDRFQVLNLPTGPDAFPGFPFYALSFVQYGKFSKGQYPFLCWEPSDQWAIQSVSTTYISCGPVPMGFRFAINIDPVQFQIYAAQQSGTALNARLETHQVLSKGDMLIAEKEEPNSPHVVVIAQGQIFFSVVFTQRASINVFEVYVHSHQFAQPSFLAAHTLPQSYPSLGVIASASSFWDIIFVSDNESNYAAYRFGNTTLDLVSSGNLNSSMLNGDGFVKSLGTSITYSSREGLLMISHIFSTSHCSIALQILATDKTFQYIKPLSAITCLLNSTDQLITKASISIIESSNITSTLSLCGNSSSVAGLIAFSTQDKLILSSAFCAPSWNTGEIIATKPKVIDVGDWPSISIASLNSNVYVLETHGEGYCYNSEEKNKRPSPKLCESVPVSTPSTLIYNYATMQDFVSHLVHQNQEKAAKPPALSEKANSYDFINSCNNNIMHGVFDMGKWSDVKLFTVKKEEGEEVLALLEVHRGLEEAIKSECGAAVPHQGIVMDAWPLVPL